MRGLCSRLMVLLGVAAWSQPLASQGSMRVDDAALREAPSHEWLSYGRDYAETHYSPLSQIDERNVGGLRLAWSADLHGAPGRVQATPLVAGGVMYVTGTAGTVFALDARMGAIRWKWDPGLVRGGLEVGGPRIGPNRGVALHDGSVFVGLADGRLVALDAETGHPRWARQTTPLGVFEYNITGAPRVVNGKVIIGNGGAEYHGVRGYVTAYDARTGEQVWRFYTVPGDPSLPFESPAMEMAATTWAGEWWKYGGGGTAWDSFSFDPEANLLYIGTGNGAPWSHFHRSAGEGDNLFLNSIVAVDADSGELVWWYQTVPADTWDYTTTMHMLLADLVIDGRERKVLMQAPKNGFFYVLDRLSGELISAEKITEHVTWAERIDLRTGRPVENPAARFDTAGAWISPGTGGAHNWEPMAWHPGTGLVYIPGQNNMTFHQLDLDWVPASGVFSTGTVRGVPPPNTPEPHQPSGFLLAWDPATQRERWRIPYETQRNGGTLTTGENLLFSTRRDGWLYAHDARTGEKLWEVAIGTLPVTPITYAVDGRQYLAILSGPPAGAAEGVVGRIYAFALDGEPR